jgi:hypothetical protein
MNSQIQRMITPLKDKSEVLSAVRMKDYNEQSRGNIMTALQLCWHELNVSHGDERDDVAVNLGQGKRL